MDNIYYSKRSGLETERILDKASGIKINEPSTEDNLLKTLTIGDTKYKPDIVKKEYVYIHIVNVYFKGYTYYDTIARTIITIDDRETPYRKGDEYLLFKSFGGGILLMNLPDFEGSTINGSFFCTGGYDYDPQNIYNGWIAFYKETTDSGSPYTVTGGITTIDKDTIYRLEMEEL